MIRFRDHKENCRNRKLFFQDFHLDSLLLIVLGEELRPGGAQLRARLGLKERSRARAKSASASSCCCQQLREQVDVEQILVIGDVAVGVHDVKDI